ncbi:hypothetical protein CALVIDRAFT_319009 [Calocera viscosa TUFC12733]|uniref:Secreted protein n=1 Tax=Calocera viscosa (strain TUFC12733) TaxID=1330018 RepID=A0A167HYU3_CALVF|nr:hypothetical protein CALVIDRAFT_319009 [Calocera viscosa TUFC12733]
MLHPQTLLGSLPAQILWLSIAPIASVPAPSLYRPLGTRTGTLRDCRRLFCVFYLISRRALARPFVERTYLQPCSDLGILERKLPSGPSGMPERLYPHASPSCRPISSFALSL